MKNTENKHHLTISDICNLLDVPVAHFLAKIGVSPSELPGLEKMSFVPVGSKKLADLHEHIKEDARDTNRKTIDTIGHWTKSTVQAREFYRVLERKRSRFPKLASLAYFSGAQFNELADPSQPFVTKKRGPKPKKRPSVALEKITETGELKFSFVPVVAEPDMNSFFLNLMEDAFENARDAKTKLPRPIEIKPHVMDDANALRLFQAGAGGDVLIIGQKDIPELKSLIRVMDIFRFPLHLLAGKTENFVQLSSELSGSFVGGVAVFEGALGPYELHRMGMSEHQMLTTQFSDTSELIRKVQRHQARCAVANRYCLTHGAHNLEGLAISQNPIAFCYGTAYVKSGEQELADWFRGAIEAQQAKQRKLLENFNREYMGFFQVPIPSVLLRDDNNSGIF